MKNNRLWKQKNNRQNKKCNNKAPILFYCLLNFDKITTSSLLSGEQMFKMNTAAVVVESSGIVGDNQNVYKTISS